jgi:hypothetical protein
MRRYLMIAAGLLALLSPAKAADSTVTALTAASALAGTELLYCVQTAADRKCTPAQLSTYIQSLISGDCVVVANVITCAKINGNTFPASGTSGGIPYFSGANAISSSAALTANLPVIGGGAGVAPSVGTRSGNTTSFGTTSGALTNGNCAKFDASGNIVDNGAVCGGTASITNHPGYAVNINGSQAWWMPIMGNYNQTGSGAYSALTAYCTIGQIGGNSLVTVNGLGTRGTVGGTTNVQFALYNNDATPNSAGQYAPGTLVVATGNIVNTGTGNIQGATLSNVQVSPGFYWFCMQSNDTTFRSSAYSQASISFTQAYVGSNGGISSLIAFGTGLSTTTGISSFGTWPTFHGATFSTGSSLPMIGFSFSSIP